MAPRQFIRYNQVRRQGTSDVQESDDAYAKGRYFEANCLATDSLMDMVRITGPSVGGVFQVTKVDVTSKTKMPAVGIIVQKPTPTTCLVQVRGEVITPFALAPGGRYFVGANSQPSLPPVPAPAVDGISLVQWIGVAIDSNRLLLEPDFDCIVLRGDAALGPPSGGGGGGGGGGG